MVGNWFYIVVDHKNTTFGLKGKHAETSWRIFHFKKTNSNQTTQAFSELKPNCEVCHSDVYQKQFSTNESADYAICHGFDNWKAERLNH